MWVCKNHITAGLKRLTAPHIQRAPEGITCSFCEQNAELNLFYAHEPSKLKSERSYRNSHAHSNSKQAI